MDLKEEKGLIDLARKDPEVFGEIYGRYYPKIFGYILRRTAHIEVAQDIASETFFKALKNLWQFRWRNISFSSWLYKIATNETNQYFRKGKYKSMSLDELQKQGLEPISLHNPETELVNAQEELKQYQDFIVCQKKISLLDVKYQEVISLRFFEKKQIKEISGILGKPEGTVKSLLHRGLKNLRILMDEENMAQPFLYKNIVYTERSKN